MLIGTATKSLLAVLVVAVLEGCDVEGASRGRAMPESIARSVPAAWQEGTLPILRFRKDEARERGWVLTSEGVIVFDFRTRETLARVALPGWTWVREEYGCPPDLVLGQDGEAVISSNVLATLWRIDPVTLEVT